MDADDVPFDPRERPPEYLYKYRSLNGPSFEFTRKIVQDSTVWFSKPSDFNDPFDWLRPSAKPPIELAACISDGWGQHTHRRSLPNPKGQTLVLEGGPPEIPVVDAVVDIETAGKGSVNRCL